MLRVTHSATQQSTINTAAFDFGTFLHLKGHLGAKDEQIADALGRELAAIEPRMRTGPMRILDVGTGEASVTELAARHLFSLRPDLLNRVAIDCVEPSEMAQQYCLSFASRAASRGFQVTCHSETIEQFLRNTNAFYNGVICCHTLYHFDAERLPDIVHDMIEVLEPEGVLLLNLVSRTSDIYRLLDQIEPRLRVSQARRCFESYGWLSFAEDVAPLLANENVAFEVSSLSAPIRFSEAEVRACREDLAVGKGDESLLIQFLAFMFRVAPADLIATAPDILEVLVGKGKDIVFKSVDHLYTIRRRIA